MCVYVYLARPEEGVGAPGSGIIIGGYKPLHGCWKLNVGPLQNKVIITTGIIAPGPLSIFETVLCISDWP